jgi:ribosomal protein L7/L12
MEHDVREAIERLTQRIRVIEANIGVLAENARMTVAQPAAEATMPPEITAMVLAGDKIGAIKAYREWMPSADLAEAKAAVDAI